MCFHIVHAIHEKYFLSVVLLLFKRRRVLQRGVCLVGLCDSGKTQLFSRLVFDKKVDSFTSMQENIGQLDLQPKVVHPFQISFTLF